MDQQSKEDIIKWSKNLPEYYGVHRTEAMMLALHLADKMPFIQARFEFNAESNQEELSFRYLTLSAEERKSIEDRIHDLADALGEKGFTEEAFCLLTLAGALRIEGIGKDGLLFATDKDINTYNKEEEVKAKCEMCEREIEPSLVKVGEEMHALHRAICDQDNEESFSTIFQKVCYGCNQPFDIQMIGG